MRREKTDNQDEKCRRIALRWARCAIGLGGFEGAVWIAGGGGCSKVSEWTWGVNCRAQTGAGFWTFAGGDWLGLLEHVADRRALDRWTQWTADVLSSRRAAVDSMRRGMRSSWEAARSCEWRKSVGARHEACDGCKLRRQMRSSGLSRGWARWGRRGGAVETVLRAHLPLTRLHQRSALVVRSYFGTRSPQSPPHLSSRLPRHLHPFGNLTHPLPLSNPFCGLLWFLHPPQHRLVPPNAQSISGRTVSYFLPQRL